LPGKRKDRGSKAERAKVGNRERMKGLVSKDDDIIKKLINCICGDLILNDAEQAKIKQVIVANCDDKNSFINALACLHLYYGMCKGEIIKILKLFLGSDGIIFEDGVTVLQKKHECSVYEKDYIDLVKRCFLNHISKHWVYSGSTITREEMTRHKATSGFSVLANDDHSVVAAQRAIDSILSDGNIGKLANLKILIDKNKELTISTENYQDREVDNSMFEINSSEFETIDRLITTEKTEERRYNGENINIVTLVQDDTELIIDNMRFTKSRANDQLRFFFKFTTPCDIKEEEGVINRSDTVGSFYVKNYS
jgi:hypothetical protein